MNQYNLVFFGSSPFSLVTLKALSADPRYRIVSVVTQPAKPVGRKQIVTPTAVETWALEHGVEVLKPLSWKMSLSEKERSRLQEIGATVGILSNYGKILPQSVIDIFPNGIVNIHPSLLPKHRGPAPAVGAILSGDYKSGTSIMLLSAEMDAGPIIGVVDFDLARDEIPATYYEKGFRLGTEKLLEVMPLYLNGDLKPMDQDHSNASYTKMLTREDGKIDWTESIEVIERIIRAYTPWPGTWTEVFKDNMGRVSFDQTMALRLGLPPQSTSTDFSMLKQMRMKVISAHIDNDKLVLDRVQLEGDLQRSFIDLPLVSR